MITFFSSYLTVVATGLFETIYYLFCRIAEESFQTIYERGSMEVALMSEGLAHWFGLFWMQDRIKGASHVCVAAKVTILCCLAWFLERGEVQDSWQLYVYWYFILLLWTRSCGELTCYFLLLGVGIRVLWVLWVYKRIISCLSNVIYGGKNSFEISVCSYCVWWGDACSCAWFLCLGICACVDAHILVYFVNLA